MNNKEEGAACVYSPPIGDRWRFSNASSRHKAAWLPFVGAFFQMIFTESRHNQPLT